MLAEPGPVRRARAGPPAIVATGMPASRACSAAGPDRPRISIETRRPRRRRPQRQAEDHVLEARLRGSHPPGSARGDGRPASHRLRQDAPASRPSAGIARRTGDCWRTDRARRGTIRGNRRPGSGFPGGPAARRHRDGPRSRSRQLGPRRSSARRPRRHRRTRRPRSRSRADPRRARASRLVLSSQVEDLARSSIRRRERVRLEVEPAMRRSGAAREAPIRRVVDEHGPGLAVEPAPRARSVRISSLCRSAIFSSTARPLRLRSWTRYW